MIPTKLIVREGAPGRSNGMVCKLAKLLPFSITSSCTLVGTCEITFPKLFYR